MRRILKLTLCALLCVLLCTCSSEPPVSSPSPQESDVFFIGDKPFKTLKEAVKYLSSKTAGADYTITMSMDAEGDGAQISGISSEIAIDFCGFSYTFTGSSSITVSNCSLEMRNVNMAQGRIEVSDGSDVSMTGNSVFSGSVSVKDSGFTVNSTYDDVSIDLTVDNAQLEFDSDVSITGLNRDSSDKSTYSVATGVTVLVENTDLHEMLNGSALKTGTWRYTAVLEYSPVAVDLGYSFTYKAKFSFIDNETCSLVVYRYENEKWTEWGSLDGTYECMSIDAAQGVVMWEEEQPSLYTGVYFFLEDNVLTLTDPENDSMVFPQEADIE